MQKIAFIIFLLSSLSTPSLYSHKIALVVSVYHESLTSKLLEGATSCLYKGGVKPEDLSIAYVPGSFEIPLAVKLLAETHRFDAIISLGAIQTTNNPQWNLVADHIVRNNGATSLEFDIPITWGIFLFDSKEQAQDTVNQLEKNMGWEASQTAISMIGLTKQIRSCTQKS